MIQRASQRVVEWIEEQRRFGLWTAHQGAVNEQTTASHDSIWQEPMGAILWFAAQRGDRVVLPGINWLVGAYYLGQGFGRREG